MGREAWTPVVAFPSWYLCENMHFCFVQSCFHSSWDEQIGSTDRSRISFSVVTCISSLTVVMWLPLLWLYLEIFLVLKRENATTDNVDTREEKLLEWNATWKSIFIIGKHASFLVFIIITCEGQWQLHKQHICVYSLLPSHTFNLFVVLRKKLWYSKDKVEQSCYCQDKRKTACHNKYMEFKWIFCKIKFSLTENVSGNMPG